MAMGNYARVIAALITTHFFILLIKFYFLVLIINFYDHLRFVMAAVSPAVVIPTLLSLKDRGYGVGKGIPTLVIAAASIDDVFAISGFGVFLGITFSTGITTDVMTFNITAVN